MKYIGGISISIKPKWGSGKINLEDNEEKLLNQLKAKWRNSLNKGLKSELIICKDKLTNESLETLISLYNESQKNKKFKGISPLFISNLSKQHESINWKFNIYFAYHKDDIDKLSPFGSLLSIISGDTCTYVIGRPIIMVGN